MWSGEVSMPPTDSRPASSAPQAPRFLGEEAKREWRRAIRILIDRGLYTELDRAALALYCAAWGRWVEAKQRLTETGGPELVNAKTGERYQNPWVDVANAAHAQIWRLITEFGFQAIAPDLYAGKES